MPEKKSWWSWQWPPDNMIYVHKSGSWLPLLVIAGIYFHPDGFGHLLGHIAKGFREVYPW